MKNEEKKELNDKEIEQVTGGADAEALAAMIAEKGAAKLAERKAEREIISGLVKVERCDQIAILTVTTDCKAAEVE